MNESISYNRIPDIDPSLPDEEQERILWETLDWFQPGPDGKQTLALSPEELERLHVLSKRCSTGVRRFAVEFLLYSYDAPLSWDDLEAWSLDPDSEIRSLALGAAGQQSGPLGRLCSDDKARCVEVVAKSVARYPNDPFQQLEWDSPEWLDIVWGHIGLLLDMANSELFARLTSRILVEVLKRYDWGPDDPHIRPWIEGEKTVRKMSLLAVARWLQLEQDNLRKITEALTQDPDPVIAQIAKAIIADHSGRFELKLEDYQTVKNWLATRDGQE